MKLRLLLLFLLLTGMLNAQQDTIRTLIITEARMDRNDKAYVEITNIGTDPVDISQFELGRVGAWTEPYLTTEGTFLMLPEVTLQPKESWVVAAVADFTEEMYPSMPDFFNQRITKKEWWELADLQVHLNEQTGVLGQTYGGPGTSDSISSYAAVLDTWGGRDCIYLEQHFPATESTPADSVVIDQVGGVFDEEDGTNHDGPYDVAGVTDATGNSVLVRKADVKQGNPNFDDARGIDISDSEWIPIPRLLQHTDWSHYRAVFWTVGNHGNYTLDENTLVSEDLVVDWGAQTITAPWGVRNNDDFMRMFEKTDGIAWEYHLSPAHEDSAYNSARTGDQLTVYACGNTLETVTFDIIVEEPTDDANIVVPKFVPEREVIDGEFRSYYSNDINSGEAEPYKVTMNNPEMDTIRGNPYFGIGYATRTDSLLKYLEKAPEAEWEFVWVDGVERADLKNGDILKVTSESGLEKEYYIKVDTYRPDHDADLSYITWPDIPEDIKEYGIYGWNTGDTIPGFSPGVTNYTLELPPGVEQIPALMGKTSNLNADLSVKRATSLDGSDSQKTVEFNVTAEDGYTEQKYAVKLNKPKDLEDIQPFEAEPFISELVFRDQWANGFVEICNPGNQPLDLSNYLFAFVPDWITEPSGAITSFAGEEDWADRYARYVPGYKWVNETEWSSSPGMLVQDLSVNSVVMPGDVFVMGEINSSGTSGFPWFASRQCDVIFNTDYNPWNESVGGATAAEEWWGGIFYIFKIVNDSVKNNLKPVNDPTDFELIEVFGQGGERWEIGGILADQITTYIRKPEYYKGKTVSAESFGTTEEDSEWIQRNRAYYQGQGFGWPQDILQVTNNLGQHFMHEVTDYKSTITSVVYKVSPGYSMNESIRGVKTGATVSTFLSGIIKANDDQKLTVLASADGSELTGDDLLNNTDTLQVMSADSANFTKYVLDVTEEGLSSDAYITSTLYVVDEDVEPSSSEGVHTPGEGSITGFEYGTQLKTILNNIEVPPFASMQVIDDEGAYVPLQQLNFDTTYVNVTVNHLTYFEVTAEDGVTQMVYQLLPQVSQSSAFVTSNVYGVNQSDLIIRYVPRGTTVGAFMSNILPSLGASVKLVDKMGLERTDGTIYQDDKLVVTAPDGETQVVYYLGMLATQLQPEVNYLAYVLSDVYTVDQGALVIGGAAGSTLLEDFYANITPAFGATAVVIDQYGEEKSTGDLDDGDMLKVVSADGSATVMYELDLDLTTVEQLEKGEILLYPNPTSGKVNINGLEKGTRLQVFNQVGSMIQDITTDQNLETISLDNQPSGMYLIVVTKDAGYLGQFKVIRK